MNSYPAEDLAWAASRLQDRISYTGWLLAIVAGLMLWALVIATLL